LVGVSHIDLSQADAYGRSFADVYDDWYRDVTDAGATARFMADRCGHGPVLELGVGSGRLARPMAEQGLTVIGLDASAAMLDLAGAHARSHNPLHLVRGDMRALPIRGPLGGVLIAFNTLFNLATEAEQRLLLDQIGGLLGDDGALVVEALDLSALVDGPANSIGVRTADERALVVTATQLDRRAQTLSGQHLEIGDNGVAIRPWRLRWLTPTQLDEAAVEAGLVLSERFGGWSEEPFTEHCDTHISVYRRP
jgi:SAM-dependent methyltransferase